MQVSLENISKKVCAESKLTEPHKHNSNPTSYSMLVPVVGAGCNNDTHDKLTDEHASQGVSTSTFINLTGVHIPALLARASGLRPTLSSNIIAGTVTATLITPVIPEASRLVVALVNPKLWNIIGA